MNCLTIIGNLTRNPETRQTNEGKTVCNFTVAVNRRRTSQNQNPEADFFRVAAWGQLGELCSKYLEKGKKVCVIGSVSVRTYQAQDGQTRASLEVFAEKLEFLSPNNQTESSTTNQPSMTPVDDPEGLPF